MLPTLGKEIGHGTHGHVYVDKSCPSLCLKMINKQVRLYNQSDGYLKTIELLSKLESNDNYKALDLVRIVEPTFFSDSATICYMKMVRILPPKKIGSTKVNKRMVLPLLGDKHTYYDHKGKGLYLGLKHLNKYFDGATLSQACYELGVMMGLIHYVGECNAIGISVFLGREYGSKKTRIYLSHFDMSLNVSEYDSAEIREMYSSINDASFFPRPCVNMGLFSGFLYGYSTVVPEHIVERVFKDYE